MCQVQRCHFSAICLCLTALLCGSTAAAQDVFPAREWAHRHPKDAGTDPKLLDQVAAMLGGRGCIIRHGYVVKQWGDQAKRGGWASSSKPVLSTLLFFAISEGLVRSVDQPVADFGWDLRPEDRGITFRRLGAMTSGYARPEGPGKAFAYNDFGIQLYQKTLFDRVFEADAGKVAADRRRLGPLGFQDGLSFTPNRIVIASVRDFARLDLFWLHKGNWEGRQLLPQSFFQRYLKPQVPATLPHTSKADTEDYLRIGTYGGGSDHFTRFGPGIYGFNWWFNGTGRDHPDAVTWPDAPRDTFMTIGVGGNCSAVMPALDTILVCAEGNWGQLEAGNRESRMNRILGLLARSVDGQVGR